MDRVLISVGVGVGMWHLGWWLATGRLFLWDVLTRFGMEAPIIGWRP